MSSPSSLLIIFKLSHEKQYVIIIIIFKLSHEKQCRYHHLYYSSLNCLTKSSMSSLSSSLLFIFKLSHEKQCHHLYYSSLNCLTKSSVIIFIIELQTVSQKAVSSSLLATAHLSSGQSVLQFPGRRCCSQLLQRNRTTIHKASVIGES
jgi:hypothetical protein